jgi:Spy/CpxP family protein refolding chaperone
MSRLPLLKESLGLTDEQASKLAPFLEEQQKNLAAFRSKTSLTRQERIIFLKEMQATNETQIRSILTPEQYTKWNEHGFRL